MGFYSLMKSTQIIPMCINFKRLSFGEFTPFKRDVNPSYEWLVGNVTQINPMSHSRVWWRKSFPWHESLVGFLPFYTIFTTTRKGDWSQDYLYNLSFIVLLIALKGWPILGCIPQLYKAVNNEGFNDFYHSLQQRLGPIYKLKGLGISIA